GCRNERADGGSGDEDDGRGCDPGHPSHHRPSIDARRRSPHVCVAALRMVMPPGLFADGMCVVSMSGWPLTGSGKSFTPCARTHRANLTAADSCVGVMCALNEPGGCNALHAWTELDNTAGVRLIPNEGDSSAEVGARPQPTTVSRVHSMNST